MNSANHIEEITASSILKYAGRHLDERAKTYDQPSGERSMARAVAALNAITGRMGRECITEEEGWMLMRMVKEVRAYTAPEFHSDSYEDLAAYAALGGECKSKSCCEVPF